MEDHTLFQPLLSTTTADTPAAASTFLDDDEAESINLIRSNSSIILRLVSIFLIGFVTVWADYEAAKGFGITIINDAKDSPAGKRFNLLYISNDKATRIILNTSSFVENFLYPNLNGPNKKQVRHVSLRLASNDNKLHNMVTVSSNANNDEFVIKIIPSSILLIAASSKTLDSAVKSMVLQGMARVWLWNSDGSKPPSWLVDGMIEYINRLAGFGPMRNLGSSEMPEFGHFCFGEKDAMAVALFLEYGEMHNKGFIQRLNQAFKDGWDDHRTVEDTLGTSVYNLCDSYYKKSSSSHNVSSFFW